MSKAVVYVRVSTKEQAEQGYSLEGQERECRLFAERHNLSVETVFIERGESAKTQNRTELQKLLRHCRENKGKISALIVWKIDRLSRNMKDVLELYDEFGLLRIQVLSVTENNEETPMGRLVRNIMGTLSQYENEQRAERTTNGMRQALENGFWCWKAPIGYKNVRIDGRARIIPDENAVLMKEAFELAASGHYNLEGIRQHLRKKGLLFTQQKLHKVMQNPLYAGFIKASWLDDLIVAKHDPIIPAQIFYQAQQHLFKRKQAKPIKHIRTNMSFPLRGLLYCPHCGKKMTAAYSSGRHGGKWGYYFCINRACKVNLNKVWVENEFRTLLVNMSLKPEQLEPLLDMVRNVWEKKHADTTATRKLTAKKLETLKAKRNRITNLLADGTIDKESYKEQMAGLNEEISTITMSLGDENKKASIDIETCIAWCREVLVDIAGFWETAPHELGVRTLSLIFPLGLRVDKAGFRTPTNSILFQYLEAVLEPENNLVSPKGNRTPVYAVRGRCPNR